MIKLFHDVVKRNEIENVKVEKPKNALAYVTDPINVLIKSSQTFIKQVLETKSLSIAFEKAKSAALNTFVSPTRSFSFETLTNPTPTTNSENNYNSDSVSDDSGNGGVNILSETTNSEEIEKATDSREVDFQPAPSLTEETEEESVSDLETDLLSNSAPFFTESNIHKSETADDERLRGEQVLEASPLTADNQEREETKNNNQKPVNSEQLTIDNSQQALTDNKQPTNINSQPPTNFIPILFRDTVPPETALNYYPLKLTNETTAVFSFSASEKNCSFQCQLDGQNWQDCGLQIRYENLKDGSHYFQVRAVDRAGNIDPTPVSYRWEIDTAPPSKPAVISPTKNITNQAKLILQGTKSEDTTDVLINDSSTGVTYPTATTWQKEVNLEEGNNVFNIKSQDKVGNISNSLSFSIFLDTSIPETILKTKSFVLTNQKSIDFIFQSDDEEATFQCQLDGGDWQDYPSPATYENLKDGSHYFQVRAIDKAGNIDPTPSVFSWTVDGSAPETILNTNLSSLTNQTTASFSFTADDPTATFECFLDDNNFSPCSSPQTCTDLTEGIHNFVAQAVDQAGNIDPTPASFTWTIDITSPEEPTINLPFQITNQSNLTLSGAKSEDTKNILINDLSDGVTYPTTTTWQKEVVLKEGENIFEIKAQDEIGNTSVPASYSILLDTIVPNSPTIIEPNSNQIFNAKKDVNPEIASVQILIKGSAEPENFIILTLNEIKYETVADQNGFWQTEITLKEGVNDLEVFSQDQANNVSNPYSISIFLDTTSPDTTINLHPLNLTNQTSATFAFSSSEENTTFQCQLDEQGWQDCLSGVNYTNLSDGVHVFEVKAIDQAGNANSTPDIFIWTIDATPSGNANLFLFDQKTNSNSYTTNQVINIVVTDDTDAKAWLISETQSERPMADDTNWLIQKPETFTLSEDDGLKTVYIWTKDELGNVSLKGNSATIFLDTTFPEIKVNPLDNQQVISTLTLSFSLTDEESGIDYWEAQFQQSTINSQQSTDWQYWQAGEINTQNVSREINQINFTGQDGYTYNFRARAQDKAGNLSDWVTTDTNGQILSTYFNLSQPDVPQITSLTDGQIIRENKITVKGTGRKGDTIILKLNSSNEYETIVSEDNTWQVPEVTLQMGLNTLNVKAKELDGDESDFSEPINVELVGPNYLKVVMNEIAWMGTKASTADEWIELYNNTDQGINLSQWTLKAVDETPSINLNGVIGAKDFYLLERTNDDTIKDIAANQTYTGALKNSGEKLELRDENGYLVDMVDSSDAWYAGDNEKKKTMERINPEVSGFQPDNWATNNGLIINGKDTDGNDIKGTPKAQNSNYPYLFVQHIYTTPNSIRLAWVDPHNVSNNLHYQLFSIQSNNCQNINWENVKPVDVTDEILPFENELVLASDSRAKFAKTIEVSNLLPNTNYCLAIKTSTNGIDWSELSNVVSKKTINLDIIDYPLPQPSNRGSFTPYGNTLTSEHSPYYLNRMYANNFWGAWWGWGGDLIIKPGTVLKFGGVKSGISALSKIIAKGTLLNPIVFTSIKDDTYNGDTNQDDNKTLPQAGDWGGIKLRGEAIFDYVIIKYAGGGEHNALIIEGSPITLSHSLIKNNRKGVFITRWSPLIRQNIFTENGEQNHFGRYFAAISMRLFAKPIIIYNDIYNNQSAGISFIDYVPKPVINYNNIYGNYRAGFLNVGTPFRGWPRYGSPIPTVEARNNWWGSEEGPIYSNNCKKDRCNTNQSFWSQGDRDAIQVYNQREVIYQPFETEKIEW
ncbi:MAG: lamin tail domain-containing protein [Armatimonadetes bacterium]|nr:lamin tail domain-containing protein [Armatimonadota bacterium]